MQTVRRTTLTYGLYDLSSLQADIIKECLETADVDEIHRLIKADHPRIKDEDVDELLNELYKTIADMTSNKGQ
jgi:hypothetical protein